MEFFTNDTMRRLLAGSLATASLAGGEWKDTARGRAPARDIEWLTIADQNQSVVDDVERIRSHPLVPRDIPIYGYIYDVASGRLRKWRKPPGEARLPRSASLGISVAEVLLERVSRIERDLCLPPLHASVSLTTALIAFDSRSQLAASFSSCLRPSRVRE